MAFGKIDGRLNAEIHGIHGDSNLIIPK